MRTRTRLLPAVLVIAGLAMACLDLVQDPYTKCYVRAVNSPWQDAAIAVDVSVPDRCPYAIPSGRTTNQNYAASVTGNSQYVGSNGYVDPSQQSFLYVRLVNPQGQNVLQGGQVQASFYFNNNPPRSTPQVVFTAGTGTDPNIYDCCGHDYGYMDVSLRTGFIAQGYADLSYTYTVSANIGAPGSAVQSTWVPVSVTASNYATPATYRWYVNNQLNASLNNLTGFNFMGGAGTYALKVEVTDADGDLGTATHTLTLTSSSGGSGDGGGGGGSGDPCGSPNIAKAPVVNGTGSSASWYVVRPLAAGQPSLQQQPVCP